MPHKTPHFEPKQRASESNQATKPESAPQLRTNRLAIRPEATAQKAPCWLARFPVTQSIENQPSIETA